MAAGGTFEGAWTYGIPISKRLFWISCFPNMVMLSWMHSSIRQPPYAHWQTHRDTRQERSSGSLANIGSERGQSYLFHPVGLEDVQVAAGPAHEAAGRQDGEGTFGRLAGQKASGGSVVLTDPGRKRCR